MVTCLKETCGRETNGNVSYGHLWYRNERGGVLRTLVVEKRMVTCQVTCGRETNGGVSCGRETNVSLDSFVTPSSSSPSGGCSDLLSPSRPSRHQAEVKATPLPVAFGTGRGVDRCGPQDRCRKGVCSDGVDRSLHLGQSPCTALLISQTGNPQDLKKSLCRSPFTAPNRPRPESFSS
ncbi:hypothetical protein CDAR_561771 [Caerostris darwini]|uniref:Uncharacterized protein n=1 Tax=Caerostris darwini TaxID=1538125 RepID=A0AAV4QLJ9_9ARAC|nr:hypothetical protein CDAR_561771 [Caerostris darwini]